MRRVLPVAIVLLSGCLSAAPQEPAAVPEALVDGPPTPVLSPTHVPEWDFKFVSDKPQGDAGLRLRLELDGPTRCQLSGGLAQTVGSTGLTSVFLLRSDSIHAWAITDSIADRHLHLGGLVDTREERDADDGQEARRTTFDVARLQGVVDVFLLARDLSAWPNEVVEGGSLLLAAACDGPVRFSPPQATRSLQLFEERTMSGGAGVHAKDVASVNAVDVVESRLVGAPLFLWGSVGGMGSVELGHPAGETQWTISEPVASTFEGLPGDYRVEVTRAGADFDYFFGALASLETVGSLDAWAAG